jgi:predicted nucleic acid-binding protein
MTRVALDSNVLVYAELEPESDKGARAQEVIAAAAPRGVIAVQSLLEFLSVVRRKRPASLPSAAGKVEAWSKVFAIAPTSAAMAMPAYALVRDHGLSGLGRCYLDAVKDAGAKVLLSEDLHDGLLLDGVKLLNPFNAANSGAVDAALSG